VNDMLKDLLQQLLQRSERVLVTLNSGTVYAGYVVDTTSNGLYMSFRRNAYTPRYISASSVKCITKSTLVRRKAGNFYPTLYEAMPYVPSKDGGLDMSATLRSLLQAKA